MQASLDTSLALKERTYYCLCHGLYAEALSLYQQFLEFDPSDRDSVWYLGLTYILHSDGNDAYEAVATWFSLLESASEENYPKWIAELVSILLQHADQLLHTGQFDLAKAIYRQVLDIDHSHQQAKIGE